MEEEEEEGLGLEAGAPVQRRVVIPEGGQSEGGLVIPEGGPPEGGLVIPEA